jgi:hypothetical protein
MKDQSQHNLTYFLDQCYQFVNTEGNERKKRELLIHIDIRTIILINDVI